MDFQITRTTLQVRQILSSTEHFKISSSAVLLRNFNYIQQCQPQVKAT